MTFITGNNITDDRDQAIEWAREMLNETPSPLFLDIETTGLDVIAEIVQVAVTDLAGDLVFMSLVKPKGVITREAAAIHGITAETVKDAPTFPEIYAALWKLIDDRRVIIYNKDFEARMIGLEIERGRLPDLRTDKWVCLMRKYAAYYREWNRYRGGYKWQKLPGGDHSAAGDCRASVALLRKMAETRKFGE